MWHVDEGALHAYLDGALDEYPAAEARRVREHLETCGACGERLAAERRVREEAQEILGLASPHVEVPSFEELRAYVKAQAPVRSRATTRLHRLSWAASVVLALGTGWLLRGGVPASIPAGERAFEAESRSAPATEAVGAADAAQGALDEEQTAPSAEPLARTQERTEITAPSASPGALQTPGSSRAAPSPQPVADAPADGGRSVEPPREPAGRPGSVAVTGRADDVPSSAGGATALDTAASKAADDSGLVPEPFGDVADALAANTRRAEEVAAPRPAAQAGAQAATQAERARQDSASRPEQVDARAPERSLRSAISQAPGLTGLGAAPPARDADAPSAPAAEADAEPVSLVVPGLEVIDVLRIGEGTTFAGMRALQRLPSGDTLETAHLPAGVDPGSLPPLPVGWSELVQPRGSGWLVMRGPVAPATLTELLQRLETGR